MSDKVDVLIVGAGHGGAQAAVALRQHKFEGLIAIVGDEPEIPYERPPLSKEYLSQEKTFDLILIRPRSFYEERDIDLVLNARVTGIDAVAHTATLADGRTISRSEEHTSELQSLMRISYAVFCLKKKKTKEYQISLLPTINNKPL